ncbi:putative short-chain dehydrogenase [Myxozyma melibiosi]|uniref:Short-chain dehydrogenase n=1 Tax=Myxozyma melibiosi TaxID=54550 RepID=A0ABR1F311_9ASCO
MAFTLGDLLLIIDKTALNPYITAFAPILLHLFTDNKFVIEQTGGLLKYGIVRPFAPLLYKSIVLFCAGAIIRLNRSLNKKALNNGVDAKFDWPKEIIVVTGGSGGIGGEAVKKLASRGSQIVVLDVLPLTYAPPKNVHFYKVDLTDYEALQEVSSRISKDIGDPTIVVANAGICRGKPILQATKRDIELTFGVNNMGMLYTAKAFLPSMVKNNHGHFLIIASQTGYLATAGVTDYSATKAAAINIYEGLQTETKHIYKAPAVRFSCISPSAVNTKMFAGLKAGSGFFMPRLSAADVGGLIAETLWSGNSSNLLVPAFAYISVPSKLFPDWMRVGMQDGGADVMSDLNPHKPLD